MGENERQAVLMSGNEACVEGALLAGINFFAGYPITPSTEIAEGLAERLPRHGGKFIQMEDEIASMAAVVGASLAGAKAMTATSGPGFSLKQENIGFAAMAEVPCVVVNVQRYGPSTGLPTSPAQGDIMQARWGTHGDHPMIALMPASVQESLTLTIEAFNLAEKFRTPVILLLDEVVGHMREGIVPPRKEEIMIKKRKKPTAPPEEYLPYRAEPDGVPPMANFGDGYRFHVTGLVHDETGFPRGRGSDGDYLVRRLTNKVKNHFVPMVEEYLTEDAEIAVVACGSVARSAKRAVNLGREQGIKVGLVRPISIWPFPEKAIKDLAGKVRAIVVPEMNLGQVALEVERCACGKAVVYRLNRIDAELITPDEILAKIQEVK
ncbi:MAG TPA: 2-oxoacid:acceptor oxidoreductase subunit alpha [Firmicutes bacterium]|nr:2-oxoacid:acceptor oxidoreductase subunit alpha [Bacillota bacterium]